jgi:transposase
MYRPIHVLGVRNAWRHPQSSDLRPYPRTCPRPALNCGTQVYPPEVRIAIVMDNFSPHLSTKKDQRVGNWATENNVELAYVPTSASWLNRIECQFTALRYFTLDGTDHRSHEEQNPMIRRYIAWRNRHKDNEASTS